MLEFNYNITLILEDTYQNRYLIGCFLFKASLMILYILHIQSNLCLTTTLGT